MTGDNQVIDPRRIQRARVHAEMKRNNVVTNIKNLFEMSSTIVSSPDLVLKFLRLARDTEHLWTQFNVENDSLLDALIDLDKIGEFDTSIEPSVRDMIAAIYVAVDQCDNRTTLNLKSVTMSESSVHCAGTVQSQSVNGLNDQPPQAPISIATPDTLPLMSDGYGARLPKIPLPSFDGTIHNWPVFRDRYLVLVGNNTRLSDIEKYYFLLNCVQGNAAEAIKGITVSGDTYALAWSTLVQRFDKPRQLATSLVEQLLSAPVYDKETLTTLSSFLVKFEESSASLNALNIPDLSAFILFVMASRCLPLSCRKLFEADNQSEYPTICQVLDFVKARVQILENSELSQSVSVKSGHQQGSKSNKPSRVALVGVDVPQPKDKFKCMYCQGTNHTISKCFKFKRLSGKDRRDVVRKNRLCFSCFSATHIVSQCTVNKPCAKCDDKHHFLLHISASTSNSTMDISPASSTIATSMTRAVSDRNVMLGTALVHIRSHLGPMCTVRALIDGGSQISALTYSCVTRLGLKVDKWTAAVTGISGIEVPRILGQVRCVMTPRYDESLQIPMTAWVLNSITNSIPIRPMPAGIKDRYSHFAMADPNFDQPGPIDLLIGADLYPSVMEGGKVLIDDALPAAFNTVFGWIIVGPVPLPIGRDSMCGLVSLTVSLEDTLIKFWQVEEPDSAPTEFTEQGQSEVIFRNQMSRLENGRFSVPLPFRFPLTPDVFEGSRQLAIKRFLNLEAKLRGNPALYDSYRNFMHEYLNLGHMSVSTRPGLYFIPHHAVLKDSADTSKVRVVFDASASCYTGRSLYDCLHTGAKLQRDIVDILLRFRTFRFVFTTDVCKMYRQILINDEFRPYQHIFWRTSNTDELLEYELNTVTYGVNCAPFLALRVIQYIAENDCDGDLDVRDALQLQTYVDDIFMGAETVDELLRAQSSLMRILMHAGFQLKKWLSNSDSVLDNIPPEDRLVESIPMDSVEESIPKVLGMQWKPRGDVFNYTIKLNAQPVSSKRSVLSVIARLFDPLGLLCPVIFFAKHLMQRVWVSKVSWDEPLPNDIEVEWNKFLEELPLLSVISIPRFCQTSSGLSCQLCGFCDASMKGYAALVYLRVSDHLSNIQVFLLCAKTKLAPIKALSIPRLELCGALLLARLMNRVYSVLSSRLNIDGIFAWSDSSVALAWIVNTQLEFKVFVSNRVNQIRQLIPLCNWAHISTHDNPADGASRGVSPSALIDLKLYWNGPKILMQSPSTWVSHLPSLDPEGIPEIKQTSLVVGTLNAESEWFHRYSSLDQLLVIVSWVRRFIRLCRPRLLIRYTSPYPTRSELNDSLLVLARVSQCIHLIQLRRELAASSNISKPWVHLRPFVDEQGLVRVGGRLSNAIIPEDQKHPILLSRHSHLSLLLVRRLHKLLCHAGPRVITAIVSRQFWIVAVRRLTRHVIVNCVTCVRFSARNPTPIMADLPPCRVQQCRPFAKVGVDYAGPLTMKEVSLRKSRQFKVYIAVFVCMSVKCVHLEPVLDLTTDAFLAAFDRFVSRRGLPSDVFSDCGTNFVGAARQLRSLVNHVDGQPQLIKSFSCNWHFNPPSAPHFGGIWEAAVKSAKSLLIRTIGTHLTTLEEFLTILTRVEAVLNSRPLTPLTSDPTDLDCLTPGHFLIGQPLCAVPTRDVSNVPSSRLTRWKMLHQLLQLFWRRWSSEYLNLLQTRPKWTSETSKGLRVNDMVVIKDNLSPPLQWTLGRVIELLPSADRVVRVVCLLTPGGELVRPVVKLVLLPTGEDSAA